MNITSVKWADADRSACVVTGDAGIFSVPANEDNRHWRKVQAWVDAGNAIADAEPELTPDFGNELQKAQGDGNGFQAVFALLLDLENRLSKLEAPGRPAIDPDGLRAKARALLGL